MNRRTVKAAAMSINKISLIIVLTAFAIGGGFIAAANTSIICGSESSSVVSDSKKSSSGKDSSVSSQGESSSEGDSSSEIIIIREKEPTEPERDASGRELPYDVMPIVSAHMSGDTSELTDKQFEVLVKAQEILSDIITDSMSDYDKAKAIHDYICLNNAYKDEALSAVSQSTVDEGSPYGVLIENESVCKGYATAFKLLCNMCGIECELVYEYEQGNDDIDHLYDSIKIGGNWYYVDVTWDDRELDEYRYKFFLINKTQLLYDHLPYEDCPETADDCDTYAAHELTEINSAEECEALIKDMAASGKKFPAFIRPGSELGVNLRFHSQTQGYDYSFDADENADILINAALKGAPDLVLEFAKTKINGETVLIIYRRLS